MALRTSAKGRKRFNDRQKSFLEQKYLQGEVTGVKVKPDASDGTNGQRVFTVEEFLTALQIQSFFSRLTAKRRQISEKENEALERQTEMVALREGLLASLPTRHPALSYNNVNLCQEDTLSLKKKFKVKELKEICSENQILVAGRRKDDYIQAITEILARCTCKM